MGTADADTRGLQVNEKSEEHVEEERKKSEKLQHIDGIFALGDCCANIGSPLPALAQASVLPDLAECLKHFSL